MNSTVRTSRLVTPDPERVRRDGDQVRHSWATELMSPPRDDGEDPRHVDSIWPIWSVLDMSPEGRRIGSDLPQFRYE